jgi:hypothetical protein
MAYFVKSGIGALAVGTLVFGASLMGSPALAKSNCKGNCKSFLAHQMIACKKACGHGPQANPCRKACSQDHVADVMECKAAANPTPPTCGTLYGSPSRAFLAPTRSLLD